MTRTELGKNLHEKLDNDNSILVLITVKKMPPEIAGQTQWQDPIINEMSRDMGKLVNPLFGINQDVKLNKGQDVVFIGISEGILKEFANGKHSISVVSETIYHELKAHINLDYGGLNPMEKDHEKYGSSMFLDPKPIGEALKYLNQAFELERNLEEDK